MNRKIAVIGSGLIGRAWAITFARAGYAVEMTDIDADALNRSVGAAKADSAPKDFAHFSLACQAAGLFDWTRRCVPSCADGWRIFDLSSEQVWPPSSLAPAAPHYYQHL